MGNVALKINLAGTDWDITTPADGTQGIGATLAAAAVSTDVVLRSGLQGLTGDWDTDAHDILTDAIRARSGQSLLLKDASDVSVITIADAGDVTLAPTGNVIFDGDLIPAGTSGSKSVGSAAAELNTLFTRKVQPSATQDLNFFSGSSVLALKIANSGVTINANGANMDLLVKGDNDDVLLTADGELNRIGVGVALAGQLGKLHVDQNDVAGAIPALVLDQADLSEEMINFITTIGVGNPIEAVGAKTLTITHFIKTEIPGPLTTYFGVGTIA